MATSVFQIKVNDKGSEKLKEFAETHKMTMSQVVASSNKAKKAVGGLGNTIKTAFVMGSVYDAINRFKMMLTGATESVLNFEHGLRTIGAITKASDFEIDALSESARQLGIDTEQSSDSIMQMALTYKRMGREVKDIPDFLQTTADLVTITGQESEILTGILHTTMNMFDASSESAREYADVLQNTVSNSSTNFVALGEGMAQAGVYGHDLGLSVINVSALLGKLSDVGIMSGAGGTALKNIFLSLTKQTDTMKKKLHELNKDGTYEVKSIQKLLSDLKDISTEEELSKMFNLRGLIGAKTISKLFEEVIDETGNSVGALERKLKEGAVSTAKAGEDIRKAWINQLKAIPSEVQNVLIEVSQAYADFTDIDETPFSILNESLTELAQNLHDNPADFENFFKLMDDLLIVVNNLTKLFIGLGRGFLIFTNLPRWTRNIGLMSGALVLFRGHLIKTETTLKAFAMSNPLGIALTVVSTTYVAIDSYLDRWDKRMNESMRLMGDFSKEAMTLLNKPLDNTISQVSQLISNEDIKEKISERAKYRKKVLYAEKGFKEQLRKIQEENTRYENEGGSKKGHKALIKHLENEHKKYFRVYRKYLRELNTFDKENLGFRGGTKLEIDESDLLNNFKVSTIKVKKILSQALKEAGQHKNAYDVLWEDFLDKQKSKGIHKGLANYDDTLEFLSKIRRRFVKEKEEIKKVTKDDGKLNVDLTQKISGAGDGSELEKAVAKYKNIVLGYSDELKNALKDVGVTNLFDKGAITEIEKSAKTYALAVEKVSIAYSKVEDKDIVAKIKNVNSNMKSLGKSFKDTDSIEQFIGQYDSLIKNLDELASKGSKLKSKDGLESMLEGTYFKTALDGFKKNWEKAVGISESAIKRMGEYDGSMFIWEESASVDKFTDSLAKLSNQAHDLGLLDLEEGIDKIIGSTMKTQLDENVETYLGYISQMIDIAGHFTDFQSFMHDRKMEEMQKEHDKQIELMDAQNEVAMKNAGENTRRQAMIASDNYKRKQLLKEQLEADRKEEFDSQKKWQIAVATMGAVQMGINAFIGTKGHPIAMALALTSATILGASQVAQIAMTKMIGGGRPQGSTSDGHSDKIPVMLSPKEYVVDPVSVDRMGGFTGVEQALDMGMSGTNKGGQVIQFITDTLVGTEEFVQDMFVKTIGLERQWRS